MERLAGGDGRGAGPGAERFEPIALLELELAGPEIRAVPARVTRAVARRRARVLVRLHGVPLGALDLELEGVDGDLDAAAAVAFAWDAFAARIDAHLAHDGLVGRARSGAPLPRPGPPPRCAQERSEFEADAPRASVVIATHERPESLAGTLEDVLALRYPRYEVIVVDSAPLTEATRRLVERNRPDAPRVRYLREPLAGLGAAHNRGLGAVEGAIVAFTDDDVIVDASWLLELARGFALADDVACVTGLILPAELETPAQAWLEDHVRVNKGYEPRLFDLGRHRPEGRLFPYAAGAFGSGANMAFRTEALRELGGFDPALGTGTAAHGGDDLAAFFAVIAAGHTLAYQPAAIVRHAHRRSPEELRALMYDYGAGLGAFLTEVVVDHPRLLPDIARRIPFGAVHAARLRTSGRRATSDGLPRDLVGRERLGVLAGSAGYLVERRRRRALSGRPVPVAAGRGRGASR